MIPKNIHQIWLGEKRIPRHIVDFMVEIRKNHPDYKYFFWTDHNVPEMPERLRLVFDSLSHPAMKSDLLRVYVLSLYGGVYLDADYKLISHLDNLECFGDYDACVVCQNQKDIDNINNSILISSKNGSLIASMLRDIKNRCQWLGPHWYAESLFKFLGIDGRSTYDEIKERCIDKNIFVLDEGYVNDKVAKHNFLASWYPNSEWQKKFETEDYD